MNKALSDAIEGLSSATREYVEKAAATLATRIEALELRLASIRHGLDGAPGRDGRDGLPGANGKDGERGPQGEPGKDGAPGPSGRDGLDGANGKDGRDGIDGKDGAPGPSGRDGMDGKDGAPGRDGKDGAPGPQGLDGAKGLDGRDGKDGMDGRDGSDGLGFDDLDVAFDGERTFTLTFTKGERVKTFPFRVPTVIYRDIYAEGKAYEAGDVVTWGGSAWIATADVSVMPGLKTPESLKWRCMVQKGREGRQGQKGDPGERGPKGDKGETGGKW